MKVNNQNYEQVHASWLTRAGVSLGTQKAFNINTKITNGNPQIVIPVYDRDGVFLFNKYRRSPLVDHGNKYTYDPGGSVSLYGLQFYDQIPRDKTIVITEGEKDCLVCWSNNIPAFSSTGGAYSFQSDWAGLFEGRDVVICYDNDEAGGKGLVKTLAVIPHARVLLLPDRAGVKDIADYVAGGGDIKELLETAQSFSSLAEVEADRKRRISMWQSTYFHDAYAKKHRRPTIKRGVKITAEGDEVTKAKQYPISELMEFGGDNKSLCIFHKESTPSFTYYPGTNSCYCFGCGKYANSIDVYRKINNCGFREALSGLNRLIS